MKCPMCKSDMWDNTVDKKSPKSPDYKCKDKNCGHPIWLPKGELVLDDNLEGAVNYFEEEPVSDNFAPETKEEPKKTVSKEGLIVEEKVVKKEPPQQNIEHKVTIMGQATQLVYVSIEAGKIPKDSGAESIKLFKQLWGEVNG